MVKKQMMKLKKGLLIWLFSVCSFWGGAQTMETCIYTADSCLAQGNYYGADTLYDRLLAFANPAQQQLILEKSALCKIYFNKYDEATSLLVLASNLSSNDSTYFGILLQKAICEMLDNKSNKSLNTLNEIRLLSDSKYFIHKSYLLEGIIQAKNFDYQNAQKCFETGGKILTPEDSTLILSILAKNKKRYKPNATVAQISSAIIPGLGQLLSCDYKNSVNSFAINGLAAGIYVYTANSYGFLIPALFFMPLLPRFYVEGIKLSGVIARKKSESINSSFTSEYFKIYQKY